MSRDDPLHQRKTNAASGKFFGAVQPLKDPEEFVCMAHVESSSVVGDSVHDRTGLSLRMNFDDGMVLTGCKLDRVIK
jgi:hypothetical protein